MARRARMRGPLDRGQILRAAVALADEQGIDALTMRALGQALGVEAMSLYNHVGGKGDLLAGMIDLVWTDVAASEPGEEWSSALRRSALSARAVLERHRWAAGLLVTLPEAGPSRLRQVDAVLGALIGAGFPMSVTDHAFHVLDSYVLGFALLDASFPVPEDEMAGLAAAFLETLPVADYPNLAAHVLHHAESRADREGDYELGLDLIIDGLERLRAAGDASGSPEHDVDPDQHQLSARLMSTRGRGPIATGRALRP